MTMQKESATAVLGQPMNRKEYKKIMERRKIMENMRKQPYSEGTVVKGFIIILCIVIVGLFSWYIH